MIRATIVATATLAELALPLVVAAAAAVVDAVESVEATVAAEVLPVAALVVALATTVLPVAVTLAREVVAVAETVAEYTLLVSVQLPSVLQPAGQQLCVPDVALQIVLGAWHWKEFLARFCPTVPMQLSMPPAKVISELPRYIAVALAVAVSLPMKVSTPPGWMVATPLDEVELPPMPYTDRRVPSWKVTEP